MNSGMGNEMRNDMRFGLSSCMNNGMSNCMNNGINTYY